MVSVLTGVSSWCNVPILEQFVSSFIELDTALSANLLFIIYINNNAPDSCGPARCLSLCCEICFVLGFTITSQAKHKTCSMTKNILMWIMKITAVKIFWINHFEYCIYRVKTTGKKNEASVWTKDYEVDIRPDFDGPGASCQIPTLIYLP